MLRQIEIIMPIVVVLLLGMGLLALGTATPDLSFVMRQGLFIVIGLVAGVAILWLGRKRMMSLAYPFYWTTVALLMLMRVFGVERNGARSWIRLGPLPEFQPSELAKLSVILVLALALHEKPIRHWGHYFKPAALALLPFALIFTEPDLGNSLVIAFVTAGILLVRGVPLRHMIVILTLAAVAVPVVLPNLQPHQRARLTSFLNPEADPLGSGYQVIQSRIAIGSGGILGKGYRQGTQSQLGFIPYQYADFVLAVVAEEGGFVATTFLLLLYGLLFWRLVTMAGECPQERDQLAIVGVLSLIGCEMFINVGVTLGLVPVTGVTLPMISYGGTSIISTILSLAIVYVIHRDRYKDWYLENDK
jgi:rod shape determining protein RodA